MAMEAMRKRQAEFMKHAGLGGLSDEEEDDEGGEGGNNKADGGTASQADTRRHAPPSLEEGSPECIMCHERSG
ncbi:unnamed protein product, partial [Ectocarpus sp. 12 AP-2014]